MASNTPVFDPTKESYDEDRILYALEAVSRFEDIIPKFKVEFDRLNMKNDRLIRSNTNLRSTVDHMIKTNTELTNLYSALKAKYDDLQGELEEQRELNKQLAYSCRKKKQNLMIPNSNAEKNRSSATVTTPFTRQYNTRSTSSKPVASDNKNIENNLLPIPKTTVEAVATVSTRRLTNSKTDALLIPKITVEAAAHVSTRRLTNGKTDAPPISKTTVETAATVSTAMLTSKADELPIPKTTVETAATVSSAMLTNSKTIALSIPKVNVTTALASRPITSKTKFQSQAITKWIKRTKVTPSKTIVSPEIFVIDDSDEILPVTTTVPATTTTVTTITTAVPATSTTVTTITTAVPVTTTAVPATTTAVPATTTTKIAEMQACTTKCAILKRQLNASTPKNSVEPSTTRATSSTLTATTSTIITPTVIFATPVLNTTPILTTMPVLNATPILTTRPIVTTQCVQPIVYDKGNFRFPINLFFSEYSCRQVTPLGKYPIYRNSTPFLGNIQLAPVTIEQQPFKKVKSTK